MNVIHQYVWILYVDAKKNVLDIWLFELQSWELLTCTFMHICTQVGALFNNFECE